MFIEIHHLQNFVPSVLNRNDLNNPKETPFGGYRRARISSQCLKRAIRENPAFHEATGVGNGFRTRWITTLIRDQLVEKGKPEKEAYELATAFATAYAKKLTEDKQVKLLRTTVLVYISPAEINDAVTELVKEDQEPDKIADYLIKKYEKLAGAPDMALFGRMLADQPKTKLEAASQVAHAFSTNHIPKMETDFFTAVDDLQPEDTTGAGMMDYADFNSACYYRYARLDWRQLIENLGWRNPEKSKGKKEDIEQRNRDAINLARKTVEGFLRASFAAVPTGKKNSHAPFQPPAFSLAVVREDGMGWNLANAFLKPIKVSTNGEDDLIVKSVTAIEEEWAIFKNGIGDKSIRSVTELPLHRGLTSNGELGSVAKNLDAWVKTVLQALPAE